MQLKEDLAPLGPLADAAKRSNKLLVKKLKKASLTGKKLKRFKRSTNKC